MAEQGNSHRTKNQELQRLAEEHEATLCCHNKDHFIACILWKKASIEPISVHMNKDKDIQHPPNMSKPPRMFDKTQQYNRLNNDELYNELYKRVTGLKELEQEEQSGLRTRKQNVHGHDGVLSELLRVKAKDPLVAACLWLDMHCVPSSESLAGSLYNPLNDAKSLLWSSAYVTSMIRCLPESEVRRDFNGFKLYLMSSLKKLLKHCRSNDQGFTRLFHQPLIVYQPPSLPNNQTLTEFDQSFNKLPIEVRKIVWELAFEDLEPRAVQPYNVRGVIKVNCRPPTLFHVCHESRKVCMSLLSHYIRFRPTQNLPKDLSHAAIEIEDMDEGEGETNGKVKVKDGITIMDGDKDYVEAAKNEDDEEDNETDQTYRTPEGKKAGGIWFSPSQDILYFGRRTFALAGETLTTGAIREQMPEMLSAVRHVGIYLMSRSLWTVTDQTQFMEDLVHFNNIETITGVVRDDWLTFEPFNSELETHITMIINYALDDKVTPSRKGAFITYEDSPSYDGDNRENYESYLNNIRDSWDRAEGLRVDKFNEDLDPQDKIEARTGIMKFAIATAKATKVAIRETFNFKREADALAMLAGNMGLEPEHDDGMEVDTGNAADDFMDPPDEEEKKYIKQDVEEDESRIDGIPAAHLGSSPLPRGATIESSRGSGSQSRTSHGQALETDESAKRIARLEEALRMEKEARERDASSIKEMKAKMDKDAKEMKAKMDWLYDMAIAAKRGNDEGGNDEAEKGGNA